MKTISLLFTFILIGWSSITAQENSDSAIQWMKFEEAIEKNQEESRKILVDVYTNWCGWCKKMEKTTYANPAIVDYINEHYYAVKLNAERKDTVRLGEQLFVNENPNGKRSPHQLAISLLNGKMGYPSTVFLDENVELLNPPISGYMDAKSLEPILHYFGENVYSEKKVEWEEYKKNFKGKVR